MCSLSALEARSPSSSEPHVLWKFRRRVLPGLFQLLVAPGLPWLRPSNLCSVFTWPSPPVSQISLCSSLIRVYVIGFRAHLDNPGGAPLRTLDLFTSVENFFLNKVRTTASRDQDRTIPFAGAAIWPPILCIRFMKTSFQDKCGMWTKSVVDQLPLSSLVCLLLACCFCFFCTAQGTAVHCLAQSKVLRDPCVVPPRIFPV